MMTIEQHNLDGEGPVDCEVYEMPSKAPEYWDAVTDVPCPVPGCKNTIVWYEAGYVPGYRVCAEFDPKHGVYPILSIRHRFLASGNAENPKLIREP